MSFTDNEGTLNGGGFASLNDGVVTFEKPDMVTASGNNVRYPVFRSQRVRIHSFAAI